MVMLLEGRHLQFFVHKKLDPSSYVSPLTERWGHVALSVRSVPFISARAFYRAGDQTRDVDPMLG